MNFFSSLFPSASLPRASGVIEKEITTVQAAKDAELNKLNAELEASKSAAATPAVPSQQGGRRRRTQKGKKSKKNKSRKSKR